MLVALLAVILLCCVNVECSNRAHHYVVPLMTSCPREKTCITIGTLLQNTEKYFTSNTLVEFQTGFYTIDTSMSGSVVIYEKRNLILAGDLQFRSEQKTTDRATFHCYAAHNILIINSENVQLSNIEFSQCSSGIKSKYFKNTKIYRALALSDQLRSEFFYNFQDLELKTLAEAATVYTFNSTGITLENLEIRNATNGIALLSVNTHVSFNIQRSWFEGGVRVWCLENYRYKNTKKVSSSITYTILQSQFHSTIVSNNRQDAFTLVSSKQLDVWLTMHNNTITSKSEQFRKGYILHIIMTNMNNFAIQLQKPKFYRGKTLINIHDDINRQLRNSTVLLQNGYFSQSAYDVEIDQREAIIVVENSTFTSPIESLFIKASPSITDNHKNIIAYLQNIVIYRCAGYPAIFFADCTIYFKEYNEISFCVLTEGIESAGSDSAYFTGGILSLFSQITFRGKMIFNSNIGEEGAAIQAHDSTLLKIEGELTFVDNTAFNGGAISFYGGSRMRIQHTASMYFIRNHASSFGGAIYIGDSAEQIACSDSNSCFYEPEKWRSLNYQVMTFINNTADEAGDVLYAPYGEYATCRFITNNELNKQEFRIEKFIRYINNYPTDMSVFSSKPTQVCLCTESRIDCSLSYFTLSREYYPGQDFNLSVVAIGVGYGSTPAFVQARIVTKGNTESYLSRLQQKQETYKQCSPVTYTVHSRPGLHTLIISLEYITLKNALGNIKVNNGTDSSCGNFKVPIILRISLKHCPEGFEFTNEQLICICHRRLTKNNIGCDINTQTVQRKKSYWIYPVYYNAGNLTSVVIHKNCPYDYCNTHILDITLTYPDEQCSYQRSGRLCGSCQGNLSMVLGNNRCLECSSSWVLLMLPITLVAGFVLVTVLSVLNLTVTIGTINGLILYAHLLQPNIIVLFPIDNGFARFLRAFIAWLNLDFGIEMCFYNGFDAFAKTLFQLAFPLYIWGTMTFIIIGSHYSTRIAKISGKNAVQVLATLFLISYSKILRVIITALSITSLEYPNHTKLVWLQDGNIDYLSGKHAFLFLVGLFLLIFLSLPYTLVLLFSQCLQRWSNVRVLSWIWKVKPLFDAYTGPLKDNHRYWTGLLLLVRVILYTVYSMNVGGDPAVNILATSITTACLLAYLVLIGGVYKSLFMTALECSYLLNVLILTVLTLYSSEAQETYTNTLVMIAFLVTCATICYHMFLRIKAIRCVSIYLRRKEKIREEELEYEAYIPPVTPNTRPVTSQVIYFNKKGTKEQSLICKAAEEGENQEITHNE